MKLKKNVGKIDQMVRYALALILIILGLTLSIYWLFIPAFIMIFTALFSFCGLYRLFGINTCKVAIEKKS